MPEHMLSRRGFLELAAVMAGGAVVAGCSPAAEPTEPAEPTAAPAAEATATPHKLAEPTKVSEPTAAPEMEIKEAPMLAEQVAAGTLPPVADRLPTSPRVAKRGWTQPGQYGGYMQTAVSFEWGLTYFPVEQFAYGSAPLQYKDDGLVIEPGVCESFEFNADGTELTLHFRRGLRWSDGTPCTTNDFMFWWEDMVLNQDYPEDAPASLRDPKSVRAEITRVDDFTIKVAYASPAPLAVDQLAMGVKGIWNSEFYMAPAHYLKQFHPKYNASLSDFSEFEKVLFMGNNPDLPTLNAWVLKTYEQGQRAVWERNPYYYVVDADGNQLPYLDGFVNTNYMSGEVERLAYLQGKVDFGLFCPFGLPDVPTVKDSYSESKQQVFLWSIGSGTGAGFVFNLDYQEQKYRQLFNTPKFMQALSHAFNREEALKVVYLGYGEMTTGTMSPKAIEFNISDEGREWYRAWRDAFVEYNPDKAKALLDEIGVTDVDGDGLREFPDGSKMELLLDFSGAQGDTIQTLEMMDRDWKAVGLNTRMNPVPPDSFRPLFEAGKAMGYGNYDASDGPNCIIFPAHIVPSGAYGWAPLEGQYYAMRGTPNEGVDADKSPWERSTPWREPEPGSPIAKLQELLDAAYAEPDPLKRYQLVYEMVKVHVETGPYMFGVVADAPQVVTVKEGLMNVPSDADLEEYALGGFTGPWIIPAPGTYDPETWYFDNPAEHMI